MTNWIKSERGKLETWDFDANKELVGTLSRIEEKVGPNESFLYTIEQDNGEEVKVWGSTALDLEMQTITVGTKIKILYGGMQINPKTKRSFKFFEVFYDGTSLSKEEAKKKE